MLSMRADLLHACGDNEYAEARRNNHAMLDDAR